MAPASRHLRSQLEGALGPEATDELLNLMPPDWTQLATKTDLAVLGTELRSEMAELRGEMKADMAQLRQEFGQLEGKFGQLEGKFGQLEGKFGQLEGSIHQAFRKQTTFLVASMFALLATMTTLMAAFGG